MQINISTLVAAQPRILSGIDVEGDIPETLDVLPDGWLELLESESAAEPFRNSNKMTFGRIEITDRVEGKDMFSTIWMNRMNNCSIALHKFSMGKFVVELNSPAGKLDALSFRGVEPATAFALLNSDATRIDDDTALNARKYFLRCLISHERRAAAASKFPKNSWTLNRLRGEELEFEDKDGQRKTGRLMYLLPPGNKIIFTAFEEGKWEKYVVQSDKVWF